MEGRTTTPGCPKCKTLEKVVREVAGEMVIDATVTKEEDIVNIMGYGIMHTPGLVINGRVVAKGRVPSAGEIRDLIDSNLLTNDQIFLPLC